MKPKVSVIIPTYNRANTISRTIDSILAQTYENYEIIVVEDGSSDDTMKILKKYNDKRLRIINHDINRGVTAAKNTGLNNIKGEWFTILDSDDEIVPEALEQMLKISLEFDNSVNAISCNCLDTVTHDFSGKGLSISQYVDLKTLVTKCTGEFWGITKTDLLLNDRFNERLGGYESTLWMKINERAKRYYIHAALRIYHTEGDDRILKIPPSIEKISLHYQVLSEETHFLEILKEYLPIEFAKECFRAIIYLVADNKKKIALVYYEHLKNSEQNRLLKLVTFFVFHSNAFFVRKGIGFLKAVKIID